MSKILRNSRWENRGEFTAVQEQWLSNKFGNRESQDLLLTEVETMEKMKLLEAIPKAE